MKKTKFLIIVFLLLMAKSVLYAQHQHGDSLRFSGTIKLLNNTPLVCRVKFNYTIDDASGKTALNVLAQTDSKGYFEARLPDLGKPFTIFFTIRELKTNRPYFPAQNYFAESKDNVVINLSLDTAANDQKGVSVIPYWARFTGIGAEKYKIAWELQNPFYFNGYAVESSTLHRKMYLFTDSSDNKIKKRIWKDAVDIDNYLEMRASLIRKYKIIKDSLIAAGNISSQMRKLLRYQYGAWQAPLNREWFSRCQIEYNNYPAFRDKIADTYFKYNKEFSELPDSDAIYSFNYLREISDRLVFALGIKNKTDRVDIKDYYTVIKTQYTGATRDYLLRYALSTPSGRNFSKNFFSYNSQVKDSILVDALNIVKLPLSKTFLEEELVTLRKESSEVYNGEFITLDGKKMELSSLKGKVVLIDIWFNGCVGCAQFHEDFKTIYPQFKGNENFVVLSINVDKAKERWLKGIASEHYTSKDPNYINVTTEKWFDHPFMKYYNITGASYVMLVGKDGKILPKGNLISDLASEISKALETKTQNNNLVFFK